MSFSDLDKHAIINNKLVPIDEAKISISSSAVLYGLTVYSVFLVSKDIDSKNQWLAFRLPEHLQRIKRSCRMIGFDLDENIVDEDLIIEQIKTLLKTNRPKGHRFFRLSIHATDLLPGVKTRNLNLIASLFSYQANPILPTHNTRIKTSLWKRTADTAIPARAKVNGAYVNSALAKQDALDSGFDDCLFLNQNGYVSELSAANIFMIKNKELITPDCSSDILEGITRRSIIELAKINNLMITERKVALTELYSADEVFACGTSAQISQITEIDNRKIDNGEKENLTAFLRDKLIKTQTDKIHPWIKVINT